MGIGKYCGWHSGKETSVGGNKAILTFHSDDYFEARGFLLFFTPVQPCKCIRQGIKYSIKNKKGQKINKNIKYNTIKYLGKIHLAAP